MMNMLASPAPVQFQTLAESSRNYEPGNQFAEFVRLQQANSPKAVEQVFYFEPYTVGLYVLLMLNKLINKLIN